MSRLSVRSIQTGIFRPGDDLASFVADNFSKEPLRERVIIAVTSKIVSLAQRRTAPQCKMSKQELIERESELFLGEIGYGCQLGIKHGLLLPSAGIDESNSESGDFILLPEDPFGTAKKLHDELRTRFGLEQLGILLTDSHTAPLRRGVTGIAIAHWGFRGLRNIIQQPDLFGRLLKMTQVNIVDALASAAVLVMGEANERCPLARIEGAEVEFAADIDPGEVRIPLQEDLYAPILRAP